MYFLLYDEILNSFMALENHVVLFIFFNVIQILSNYYCHLVFIL